MCMCTYICVCIRTVTAQRLAATKQQTIYGTLVPQCFARFAFGCCSSLAFAEGFAGALAFASGFASGFAWATALANFGPVAFDSIASSCRGSGFAVYAASHAARDGSCHGNVAKLVDKFSASRWYQTVGAGVVPLTRLRVCGKSVVRIIIVTDNWPRRCGNSWSGMDGR